MPDLLIELLSEEIPARMQESAAAALHARMVKGLRSAGLPPTTATAYATPRRLVLHAQGIPEATPPRRDARRGPRVGASEAALAGFLGGLGVTQDQLEQRDTPRGRFYFATLSQPARPAAKIVAPLLEATIRTFPWPKSMRWGEQNLRWVRPLHSILCLLYEESADGGKSQVVPLCIEALRAGRSTRGHRVMRPQPFDVKGFTDYRAQLEKAHVILDAAERARRIWQQATALTQAQGLEALEDVPLLQEVVGLVEWPVVRLGKIEGAFLDLPPAVLQTSMRSHQKFFAVRNPQSKRIEAFLVVADIATRDNEAAIVQGNGRVLAARLADARFFWENDLRIAKEGGQLWAERLGRVIFHNKLGSQAVRICRLASLAARLAPFTGADSKTAAEAARWAKLDLASEMVAEFPELQGVMGRYYAPYAQLSQEIAAAAEDHYAPLGPSDRVPDKPIALSLALADKLDRLAGFWCIGETPTGSKDPQALRRAALGVVRLILERQIPLPLKDQLIPHMWGLCRVNPLLDAKDYHKNWGLALSGWQKEQKEQHPNAPKSADMLRAETLSAEVLAFLHDRLKVYLRETETIRADVIDACTAMRDHDNLLLLAARARALQGVVSDSVFADLLQGFRRANNILAQAEAAENETYADPPEEGLATETAEQNLFDALNRAEERINHALSSHDFATALRFMAELRDPIDRFLDSVHINTDDKALHRNRLNLLGWVRAVCLQVADLCLIREAPPPSPERPPHATQ